MEATFPGESQPLTSFSFGDLIGELSLLAETPRLMTVRAIAATELLSIDRQQLTYLTSRYPQIAEYLEHNLRQHRIDHRTAQSSFKSTSRPRLRNSQRSRLDTRSPPSLLRTSSDK